MDECERSPATRRMCDGIGMLRRIAAVAVAAVLLSPEPATPVGGSIHSSHFGVGERLEYDVSFGRLHVGSGEMWVVGIDTLDSHPTWHAQLTVSGGIPWFGVHDTTLSWFDTGTFVSRRFVQHIHEGRYGANRTFAIDPERGTYSRNDRPPVPTSIDPVDDISLIYLVRTLPLADGDRYELHRYFQPEGNPVVIRVIRHERITVPAGTFAAILIQPEITTSGIFSQNGRAQLWLSDDSTRALLQMKAGLSFGSINLYLRHVAQGKAP